MKKSCGLWLAVGLLSWTLTAFGQRPAVPYFPDVKDYKTLVCDFHMHTVFSDGTVWPTVRVQEAEREGLDAIVLSDHIEYQPHRDDIPTQHERPYEIALPTAQELNILLIKGAEITKDTPPGHYNGIFLQHIASLDHPDVLDAVKAAADQKAFVFWNHHTWKGIDRGQWQDVQTVMLKNNWLHGMEVANGNTYYPLAHQWCLDKNLTMIGSSDIHQPSIEVPYTPQQHRTLTLVLAKERSVQAIREALFAGRTLVWYQNQLIGPRSQLEAIYKASVVPSPIYFSRKKTGFFELTNRSFLDLQMQRTGKNGPQQLTIPAHSSVSVKATLPDEAETLTLSYVVTNMLTAPDTPLDVNIEIALPQPAEAVTTN
ncbi:MAG: histidinol-phosphatase [Planctomycetes bacterium]|nr:histidinol-phosphatase [Planctomycetota bacterium]